MTKKLSAQVYNNYGFARDRVVLEEYETAPASRRSEVIQAIFSLAGYAAGAGLVIYFAFFN